MNTVRSLLLGTAAGLAMAAAAQAADMPVKAKPVQYVKICTLYGDGFYYIPGTDICLKIGGYIRAEYAYNYGANLTNGPFASPNGYQTRTNGQDWTMRSRAYAWFDSRQQTEYGTLRTYFQVGVNYDSPTTTSTSFNANRAFIQFSGFTIGTAQSFYEIYSGAAVSYYGQPGADTGDGGWKVLAYTSQWGNGVSSTVSIEEPRNAGVINTDFGNIFTLNNAGAALATPDRAGTRFPDLVSNFRVDQAWGSAQVMFAAHDASGGYYGTTLTGSEVNGHPADKLGWAVGAGAKLNTFGGSYFQFQVNYTQGAVRYANVTPAGAFAPVEFSGSNLGYGFFSDGVYSLATGDVQLTTMFGINAAYDHFWRPDLRTSIYGYYDTIRYNATANTAICSTQTGAANPAGTISFTAPGASGPGGCNSNWSWWAVGSRTQYNFTPYFYVGFDVFYQKLHSASEGAIVRYTAATGTAKPTGLYTISDQDNIGFKIRFQRDIVP